MRRTAMLLIPVLALAAGCNTMVSDSRVAPMATVLVSQSNFVPAGPNTSSCPSSSDVSVLVDGDEVETGTADASGNFSIEITAPADPASYSVQAVCSGVTTPEEGEPVPYEVALNPTQLIVEPVLTLTADPAEVVAGATFHATGTWCVSQFPDSTRPIADITFAGETEQVVADDAQPFDDTWSLELTAPDEPGTYEITGVCSYDDGQPAEGESPDVTVPEGFGDSAVEAAAVQGVEYPAAEVVVVAAPVTPVTPAPVAPVTPRAPSAGAVVATPAYTG